MELNNIPNYIDEEYRINLVKEAKEKVSWISPRFSNKEKEAIDKVKQSLGDKNVWVYNTHSRNINDDGYCFSIDENNRLINIKLRPKNCEDLNESLLIIDNIVCIYNHELNNSNINAWFMQGVDTIEYSELLKRIEKEKSIQINILDKVNNINGLKHLTTQDEHDLRSKQDETLSIKGNINVIVDVVLEEIQAKIKKVDIKVPGSRTNQRNIEMNDILNIIGKADEDINERLCLRWQVFGDDYLMKAEYMKYGKELEKIITRYTMNLKPFGEFIQVKNIKEFEDQIDTYRRRLKTNSIDLVEQKILESKSIIEKLINQIYSFATKHNEDLKTCSYFEMQNIVEIIKSKFPSINDVAGTSDVLVNYSELSKDDITNKELCKKLLAYMTDMESDLYKNLCKIINY